MNSAGQALTPRRIICVGYPYLSLAIIAIMRGCTGIATKDVVEDHCKFLTVTAPCEVTSGQCRLSADTDSERLILIKFHDDIGEPSCVGRVRENHPVSPIGNTLHCMSSRPWRLHCITVGALVRSNRL
jgi:hypothetical protein